MTKFETIGVNYQYAANSKEEANKAFAHSCNCCCNKGMRIDCMTCAIAHTHYMVSAYFDDKEARELKALQHKINEKETAV